MGQKINPFSYRLGIYKGWNSRWYPKRGNFKSQLEEDLLIRKVVNEKIGLAGIVRVEIERTANDGFRVFIKAAKPGLIIGRGGKGIEDLNKLLETKLKKLFVSRGVKSPKIAMSLNIEELKRSEASAQFVAQSIAWDMERRTPFRRTIKKALEQLMQNRDVLGAKVRVSGRLDGSEIARSEWLAAGKLPLNTLRADLDFGMATAFTSYGTVGVKIWINKGEVFIKEKKNK